MWPGTTSIYISWSTICPIVSVDFLMIWLSSKCRQWLLFEIWCMREIIVHLTNENGPNQVIGFWFLWKIMIFGNVQERWFNANVDFEFLKYPNKIICCQIFWIDCNIPWTWLYVTSMDETKNTIWTLFNKWFKHVSTYDI